MNHIGIENTITIKGKAYKLSRFTRATWREFLAYCKTVIVNPIDMIADRLPKLPVEQQNRLIDKAYEDAKEIYSIGSPAVQQVMGTLEGLCYLFWLLIKQHHPEMTEDEAGDLCIIFAKEYGQAELDELLAKASGVMPETELEPRTNKKKDE